MSRHETRIGLVCLLSSRQRKSVQKSVWHFLLVCPVPILLCASHRLGSDPALGRPCGVSGDRWERGYLFIRTVWNNVRFLVPEFLGLYSKPLSTVLTLSLIMEYLGVMIV